MFLFYHPAPSPVNKKFAVQEKNRPRRLGRCPSATSGRKPRQKKKADAIAPALFALALYPAKLIYFLCQYFKNMLDMGGYIPYNGLRVAVWRSVPPPKGGGSMVIAVMMDLVFTFSLVIVGVINLFIRRK
jgi:hypothetical protein